MTNPAEVLADLAEQERKRILSLEGPALDAEVSVKVFHIPARAYPGGAFLGTGGALGQCPKYSSDLGAAWSVVERITDPRSPCNQPPAAVVPFWMPPGTRFGFWFDSARLWSYSASDAALEICRAALLATQDASR